MSSVVSHNSPIATNPQISSLRISLWGSITLCILGMSAGIYFLLFVRTSSPDLLLPSGWMMLALGLFFIFFSIRRYIQLRSWQCIEHRRFAAAVSEEHLSALVLPVSTQPALPPLMLSLRLKMTHVCFLAMLVLGSITFNLGSLVVQFAQEGQRLDALSFFTAVFFSAIGVLIFVPLFFVRNTIEATNDGLKAENVRKVIRWEEARLFACYHIPSISGRKTVITYELSSQSQVVSWNWILNPQSPLTVWKPLLPADEYHQQIRALCELIVARTGLQLCDLSRPREDE